MKKAFHQKPIRQKRGNMSVMIVMAVGGVVVVLLIGIVVSILLMSQKRSQSQTEQLALSWSTELNKDNWLGNMNNMMGFSREMVFSSRQDLDTIIQKHPRLKPLALQIMDESRQGAILVEEERKTLIAEELKLLKASAENADKLTTKTNSAMSVHFVSTDNPTVTKVESGFIEGVASNVYLADGIADLKDFDIQSKYAVKNGKVLNGNINAKLPSPDDDLDFKIASLPAPAGHTISPARLTANNVFRKSFSVIPQTEKDLKKCDQLPSAIQVETMVSVKTPAGDTGTKNAIRVMVTSATPGATESLP